MNAFFWNSQCITLKDKGEPYGYIALIGSQQTPALGGVRIIQDAFNPEGMHLSLALAGTMYYKARESELPLSGGKAILYIPDLKQKPYFLKRFSNALNKLQGQYITAVDVGSDQNDMDLLRRYSRYVTCHSAVGGDPSPYTAKTVLLAVQAACEYAYDDVSIDNKHIVIQGVGKVGSQLLKQLREASNSVNITITDILAEKLAKEAIKHQINIVKHTDIYTQSCDIFIASADAHLVGEHQAKQLNCRIFAAAANNPFVDVNAEAILQNKGAIILPDYLINSGGLIFCAYQYGLLTDLDNKIHAVYHNVSKYLAET
jgi:leucine dehydrogenase